MKEPNSAITYNKIKEIGIKTLAFVENWKKQCLSKCAFTFSYPMWMCEHVHTHTHSKILNRPPKFS